jgi:hypothetical protein
MVNDGVARLLYPLGVSVLLVATGSFGYCEPD